MSANNSIIVQIRRGNSAQTALFTGALAELTVDTDINTIVVHDGSTVGGHYLAKSDELTPIYDEANAAIVLAQSAYDAANLSGSSATVVAAFNKANTAYDNTVYLQGVNDTQNTNITSVNGYAASAYNTANGANGLAAGAFASANTNANAITIIQGVDTTQNTRLNSIETINTNQNTTIGIIQGVDDGQNTRISSANNYAFSAFARANTALANTVYLDGVNNTQNTQIQGVQSVNTTQNTNITAVNNFAQGAYNKANSAATTAQAAFDKANTQSNSFSTITVANTASFNGLTQVQQLDLPYTAKTSATGTVTHDCSVGQIFYHTSISGNFTANLINLGITSGYITEVKLYLVQGGTSRSITALQIAGAAKTINWYNAVNPTYSTNAVDVVTFTILLVNTTYTVFGKVEKYDSVAAGGGGGGG